MSVPKVNVNWSAFNNRKVQKKLALIVCLSFPLSLVLVGLYLAFLPVLCTLGFLLFIFAGGMYNYLDQFKDDEDGK